MYIWRLNYKKNIRSRSGCFWVSKKSQSLMSMSLSKHEYTSRKVPLKSVQDIKDMNLW